MLIGLVTKSGWHYAQETDQGCVVYFLRSISLFRGQRT